MMNEDIPGSLNLEWAYSLLIRELIDKGELGPASPFLSLEDLFIYL